MYGKISCVAKGARKPRSALLAGTQMFCFGEYLMFKGSQTYHINSVEPIEVFYNLRIDLDKLKYAVHINKIIQDVTNENQNCYKILQLLLNTLYIISETDKNLDMVLSVFKLRLLCILGFTPQVMRCKNCDEKEKLMYFSESAWNAIKYTVTAPPKRLYSFNLKEDALEEFKLVSKLYFNEKLEKEYKLEDLF